MKNIVIIFASIILGLSGCSNKYNITPSSLPQARVGQFYQQTITITGGKVIDKYFKLDNDLPQDLGLKIHPQNDLDGYNTIILEGTPLYKGKYTIKIHTGFYSRGGTRVDKTYDFIVTD